MIKYNEPYEITEKQYNEMRVKFAGIIAHKHDKENGKYYFYLWVTRHRKEVQKYLDDTKVA